MPRKLILLAVVIAAGAACDVLLLSKAKVGDGQGTASGSGSATNTALTRASHEMFFPINAGAHASTDCNGCHGGFATFKQFTCISCHDHEQATTDANHAGVAGYAYDSQSCLGCHPQGTAGDISRAQHAMFFAIDVGTAHAASQCSDCHTNPADRSQFTCLTSCHAQAATDTTHAGVAGYVYNSQSCLGCHPQGAAGEISRADHAKFFAIDVGTAHASSQCSDCHTNPADRSQFTCLTSCHAQAATATTHAGVAVYTYDSKACLTCHPAGQASLTRAAHAQFMNISSGNHNLQCKSCHKTADYSVYTCLDCHSSNSPSGN
jgi:hypothetical protein